MRDYSTLDAYHNQNEWSCQDYNMQNRVCKKSAALVMFAAWRHDAGVQQHHRQPLKFPNASTYLVGSLANPGVWHTQSKPALGFSVRLSFSRDIFNMPVEVFETHFSRPNQCVKSGMAEEMQGSWGGIAECQHCDAMCQWLYRADNWQINTQHNDW